MWFLANTKDSELASDLEFPLVLGIFNHKVAPRQFFLIFSFRVGPPTSIRGVAPAAFSDREMLDAALKGEK